MKKRKFPWILMSFAILLVAAMAIVNVSGALDAPSGHDHNQDHSATAQAEEPQVAPIGMAGASAAVVSRKEEMAKSLKGAPKDLASRMPEEGVNAAAGAPAQAQQPQQAWRPTPTDNMTSSQWFAEEFANTTKGK